MHPLNMRRLLPLAALLALVHTVAAAQTVVEFREELDFDRPEAWAQKYFTSVSLLTGFGAPSAVKPGGISIELETGWVPSLNEQERTVGFEGTKPEDLNRTDVFGRLRLMFGLPAKLSLTIGYSPPVELDGVESSLTSAAIGRPLFESDRARLGLRLYAQKGTIEGDITCTADETAAGNDPVVNPFNCMAPSADELQSDYAGLEFSSSFLVGNSRWEPYVAVSVNRLDLEFQVNAAYSGIVDRTLQTTDGWTYSVSAGSNLSLSDRWSLAGEVFFTPLNVVRPPNNSAQSDGLLNVRVLLRVLAR